MFDADPRNNPDAQLIFEARADDPALDAVAGGTGGALGRGGMQTKLRAARLAARSGAHTVIVGGRIERVLARLKGGERLGTLLSPERGMLAARKQWLAGHLQTRGTLVLDDGAVSALARDTRVCCRSASSWCRAASGAARWWFAWHRMGVRSLGV